MAKKLNILNVLACYNSLDIMPYILKHNREEGIDSFVIDNYSNDGSWEYLQDNKIPSRRFDTGGAFYTTKIQAAKLGVIRELQPDWVLRGSSDHFILTPKPLRETIEKVHSAGYNTISMPFCRVWNTGETRTVGDDPRDICFYYAPIKQVGVLLVGVTIHKTVGFIGYQAEAIHMDRKADLFLNGACLLDYGNTRNKAKREDEYRRTQLAWERGEPRGYGTHYINASKRGWIWKKEELKDIRKSEYWPMLCSKFGLKGNQ